MSVDFFRAWARVSMDLGEKYYNIKLSDKKSRLFLLQLNPNSAESLDIGGLVGMG